MNKDMKLFITILAVLFVLGGAFALGASTAPSGKPAPAAEKKTDIKKQVATPTKEDLKQQLATQTAIITAIIQKAYPVIATDYMIGTGKLYDDGKWYGVTLTYKGSDTMNRDTLRVLLQKKNGVWVLRTTPPEPLLSAKKYQDVPVSVLKSINTPVSLPGTDNSPTINPNE